MMMAMQSQAASMTFGHRGSKKRRTNTASFSSSSTSQTQQRSFPALPSNNTMNTEFAADLEPRRKQPRLLKEELMQVDSPCTAEAARIVRNTITRAFASSRIILSSESENPVDNALDAATAAAPTTSHATLHHQHTPVKRGRGRPRKDGSSPLSRDSLRNSQVKHEPGTRNARREHNIAIYTASPYRQDAVTNDKALRTRKPSDFITTSDSKTQNVEPPPQAPNGIQRNKRFPAPKLFEQPHSAHQDQIVKVTSNTSVFVAPTERVLKDCEYIPSIVYDDEADAIKEASTHAVNIDIPQFKVKPDPELSELYRGKPKLNPAFTFNAIPRDDTNDVSLDDIETLHRKQELFEKRVRTREEELIRHEEYRKQVEEEKRRHAMLNGLPVLSKSGRRNKQGSNSNSGEIVCAMSSSSFSEEESSLQERLYQRRGVDGTSVWLTNAMFDYRFGGAPSPGPATRSRTQMQPPSMEDTETRPVRIVYKQEPLQNRPVVCSPTRGRRLSGAHGLVLSDWDADTKVRVNKVLGPVWVPPPTIILNKSALTADAVKSGSNVVKSSNKVVRNGKNVATSSNATKTHIQPEPQTSYAQGSRGSSRIKRFGSASTASTMEYEEERVLTRGQHAHPPLPQPPPPQPPVSPGQKESRTAREIKLLLQESQEFVHHSPRGLRSGPSSGMSNSSIFRVAGGNR